MRAEPGTQGTEGEFLENRVLLIGGTLLAGFGKGAADGQGIGTGFGIGVAGKREAESVEIVAGGFDGSIETGHGADGGFVPFPAHVDMQVVQAEMALAPDHPDQGLGDGAAGVGIRIVGRDFPGQDRSGLFQVFPHPETIIDNRGGIRIHPLVDDGLKFLLDRLLPAGCIEHLTGGDLHPEPVDHIFRIQGRCVFLHSFPFMCPQK